MIKGKRSEHEMREGEGGTHMPLRARWIDEVLSGGRHFAC